jgi:hypothetical protein
MNTKNRDDYIAYMPVKECGGFGDIVAGIALSEHFKENGIRHKIDFGNPISEAKYAFLLGMDKDFFNNGVDYDPSVDRDVRRIDVCPISDPRKGMGVVNSDLMIDVEEYNKPHYGYNPYGTLNFQVHTGLNFHSGMPETIQAGIYERPSLEKMLDEVDADPSGSREKLRNDLSIRTYIDIPEELMDASWSLMYPSTVDPAAAFMYVYDEAKKHIEKPLLIFSLSAEESRKQMIASRSRRNRFNYISHETQSDNGSNVTVLELGNVQENLFQRIIANMDAPSLITGDHSLSQMLQKNKRESAVPFFYQCGSWKYALAGHIDHFMREFDPYSADIFSSFIREQDPQNTLMHYDVPFDMNEKHMAELFYNPSKRQNFINAQRNIRQGSIKKRLDEMPLEKAKMMWNVQSVVANIVEGIRDDKPTKEIWDDVVHH